MTHRVVILGEGGVGKSCLTIQLCHYYFEKDYDPIGKKISYLFRTKLTFPQENSYRKQLTVDEEACVLDIRDTAGQEDLTAIRDQHMQLGNGFALVYSVTSRTSFQVIKETYESILRVKEHSAFPCVIIGNKIDLNSEREVQTKEGKELAKELHLPFFESSAKTRINVDEPFMELVRFIRKWEKVHVPQNTEKPHKRHCVII